ncbi:unnamed protein product [Notodromas monacha]|uniref:Uncharacterized protein n=1 Tax=Notodromas monacha TaxID=399045 RepID=A0A7R9BP92_9CRUS|nr:unnamed protein product [Notodromas monacha]CAG0918873.1 unnamed protein product [Notodromas monacha]
MTPCSEHLPGPGLCPDLGGDQHADSSSSKDKPPATAHATACRASLGASTWPMMVLHTVKVQSITKEVHSKVEARSCFPSLTDVIAHQSPCNIRARGSIHQEPPQCNHQYLKKLEIFAPDNSEIPRDPISSKLLRRVVRGDNTAYLLSGFLEFSLMVLALCWVDDGQSELKVGSWILNSANLQGAHVVDPYLCKALEEMLFKKKSVLDLGCGIGLYGICFLRLRNHTFPNSERDFFTRHLKGLKDWWNSTDPVLQSWTGYDGTPGIQNLTAGLVKHMDLSKPGYIGRTFNWVLSLEVGEHIPRKYQANYISNLVRHAEEGIVLSWAIEGQGGRSHVNNRNNDIIIAILEGHGFYPQPGIWKSLRGNSSLYWFKNTVMA